MNLTLTATIDGVPYEFHDVQHDGETRAQTVQRCIEEQVEPFMASGGLKVLESLSAAWS